MKIKIKYRHLEKDDTAFRWEVFNGELMWPIGRFINEDLAKNYCNFMNQPTLGEVVGDE